MITMTLARKPMPGAASRNVMKFGTGGINVDACRVGTTKDIPASESKTASPVYGNVHFSKGGSAFSGYNPNIGRWPANIVFEHLAGCVRGEPRTDEVPLFDSSHTSRYIGCEGVTIQSTGESREMLTETWVCLASCPVRNLDNQSGESLSVRSTGRNGRDNAKATFGLQRSDDLPRGHDDAGTAARFFMQFQE